MVAGEVKGAFKSLVELFYVAGSPWEAPCQALRETPMLEFVPQKNLAKLNGIVGDPLRKRQGPDGDVGPTVLGLRRWAFGHEGSGCKSG